MPEFTYDDRNMLDAESRLWCVIEIMRPIQAGAFTERSDELRESIVKLARELQDYNDQFEHGGES